MYHNKQAGQRCLLIVLKNIFKIEILSRISALSQFLI